MKVMRRLNLLALESLSPFTGSSILFWMPTVLPYPSLIPEEPIPVFPAWRLVWLKLQDPRRPNLGTEYTDTSRDFLDRQASIGERA